VHSPRLYLIRRAAALTDAGQLSRINRLPTEGQTIAVIDCWQNRIALGEALALTVHMDLNTGILQFVAPSSKKDRCSRSRHQLTAYVNASSATGIPVRRSASLSAPLAVRALDLLWFCAVAHSLLNAMPSSRSTHDLVIDSL